jgi:SOS response regulatory protein OraA/RecX
MKIEIDQENHKFIILYHDGKPWKKVDKALFFRYIPLLQKQNSYEAKESFFYECECKIAKALAIKWLSKKAYFSHEISAKLSQKGLSSRAIEEALIFCKNIDAVNDERQIEEFVERELKRGHGPLWILNKYRRMQGSSEKKLEALLKKFEPLQKQVIKALLKKRGQRKDGNAQLLFLLRRGFRKESIFEVLKEGLDPF